MFLPETLFTFFAAAQLLIAKHTLVIAYTTLLYVKLAISFAMQLLLPAKYTIAFAVQDLPVAKPAAAFATRASLPAKYYVAIATAHLYFINTSVATAAACLSHSRCCIANFYCSTPTPSIYLPNEKLHYMALQDKQNHAHTLF